jgi:hypothetical protein
MTDALGSAHVRRRGWTVVRGEFNFILGLLYQSLKSTACLKECILIKGNQAFVLHPFIGRIL